MSIVEIRWSDGPLAEFSEGGRIEQVARAQTIAVVAHRGQVDKNGVAYIHHPAAVASPFDPLERTLEHCAGWLHDVLEDTDLQRADLELAGIHPEILDVVDVLTFRDGQDRDAYYRAIRDDPSALAVKYADIAHNTAPDRVAPLSNESRARLRKKYDHALEFLGLAQPDHAALNREPRFAVGNIGLRMPSGLTAHSATSTWSLAGILRV